MKMFKSEYWEVIHNLLCLFVKILMCSYHVRPELIMSENGCPFTFDLGNMGYDYVKPEICRSLLPPYYNQSGASGAHSTVNATLNLGLHLMEDFSDTYKLTLQSKTYKFRLWDVIIHVREVLSTSDSEDKQGTGVGFFERKEGFKPYCCDNATVFRNMIRFVNPKGIRPPYIYVRWTPLRFVGNVTFVANVFSSRTEYVLNVTSKVYSIPFPQGSGPVVAYDEDWPVGHPSIPVE